MDTASDTTQQMRSSPVKRELYPAFLSLEGKACIVIGGGRVAARKVRSLLDTGAHIVVISPLLHAELQGLLATTLIRHISRDYSVELLADAAIVFAATNNPEVNLQVARDAHERGLWVNVADNPAASNFYVPATIRRKDLTLAISTEGGAPAFARYVRELLTHTLNEALGQALEMIVQARPRILAEPEEHQAQLWESLLALRLETIIETEGYPVACATFAAWLAQNTGHTIG